MKIQKILKASFLSLSLLSFSAIAKVSLDIYEVIPDKNGSNTTGAQYLKFKGKRLSMWDQYQGGQYADKEKAYVRFQVSPMDGPFASHEAQAKLSTINYKSMIKGVNGNPTGFIRIGHPEMKGRAYFVKLTGESEDLSAITALLSRIDSFFKDLKKRKRGFNFGISESEDGEIELTTDLGTTTYGNNDINLSWIIDVLEGENEYYSNQVIDASDAQVNDSSRSSVKEIEGSNNGPAETKKGSTVVAQ